MHKGSGQGFEIETRRSADGLAFSMMLFLAMSSVALAPEIVPRLEQVGPGSGYMNVTSLVGTLLAPWLFGAILDSRGTGEGTVGYLWRYLLLGLFALVGTVAATAYLVIRRREEGTPVAR